MDQTLAVTRYAETITLGVASIAVASTFNVVGSIQPLSLRETQLLASGARHGEQRKLFCLHAQAELRVANQFTHVPADRLSYDGKTWEVYGVTKYDEATGNELAHYRYDLIAIAEED